MTVTDGEKVNAAVTNSGFVSKTATSGNEVTGIIKLNNTTDGNSGAVINNTQEKINDNADRISTNETDISTNASDIASLEALNPSTRFQLAGTLTPPGALTDGTGTEGEVYRVDSDGDVTFDGGTTEHFVKENDWIYYDGSNWRVVNFQNFVSNEDSISTGSLVLSADGGNFVVATNSSLTSLIGIEASMKGAPVLFLNKTGNDITVLHQDAGAPAGQKFDLIDDTDITLKDSGCLLFAYDDVNDNWVLVGGSGTGGGSGTADPNQIITGENRNFNNGLGDWISKKPKALSVSSIDTGADTITFGENHGFAIDSVVTYDDGGGTAIGGLTTATDYYVIEVPSKTSIKVSATEGGSAVDITGASTDGNFTLNGVGLGSGDGLDDATSSSDFEIVTDTVDPIYGDGSATLIKYSGSSNENYIVTLPNQSVPYGIQGEPLKLRIALKDNGLSADYIDVWVGENETDTVKKIFNSEDGSLTTGDTPGYEGIYYPSSGVETVNLFFRVNTTSTSAFSTGLDNVQLFWEPEVSLPNGISQEIDLTGSGDFTAGKIRVSKSGQLVIVDLLEQAEHSSASSAESAAGLLPEWARPDTTLKRNTYFSVSAVTFNMIVESDGTLGFNYDGSNRTNSEDRGSIAYTVSDTTGTTEAISLSGGLAKVIAEKNSVQSIPDSTATKMTFDVTTKDTSGSFSSNRFTANRAMSVDVNAVVAWASNASGFRQIDIYKNGSSVKYQAKEGDSTVGGLTIGVSALVDLEKNDYIEIYLQQTSGSSLDTTSNGSANYITISEDSFSQTALLNQAQDVKIELLTASGTGSSATRIVEFASTNIDKGGSSLSAENSATNGSKITVNEAGNYNVVLQGQYSLVDREYGITKNQTTLTTNVSGVPESELMLTGTNIQNRRTSISLTDYFEVGDVIRASVDAGGADLSTTAGDWKLIVKKVNR